jgi:TrmH family RNA methyltransferase
MTAKPGQDAVHVVLVSTRNPLNIGAVARAMSNFGFGSLRLVNPFDPSFREARSAVGATGLMSDAVVVDSVADAVQDCSLVIGTTAATNRELHHPLRPLSSGATSIREHLSIGNVALLFGSEKRGLSNEDLAHCHFLLRIPTREAHASMNLGQAVAICLYELSRDAGVLHTPKAQPLATAADTERVTQLLFEALQKSGYIKPRTSTVTEEKIRRMIRRFHLEAADAEDFQGMLRKIIYRLTIE